MKIYRSITEYGEDPERFKAWVYLLLDAEWNGDDVGKVTTTWTELAKRWGFYRNRKGKIVPHILKAKRILDEMVKDGRVEVVCSLCVSCVSAFVVLIKKYAELQGKKTNPVCSLGVSCVESVCSGENEQVPEPTSEALINKNNKNKRTKTKSTRKPSSPVGGGFRVVTDYIWRTYEEKYGVKPGSSEGKIIGVRLRPFMDEFGEETIKKAWDRWLLSNDEIAVECNHSPKTFSSDFCFNKYRVAATKKKEPTPNDFKPIKEGPIFFD